MHNSRHETNTLTYMYELEQHSLFKMIFRMKQMKMRGKAFINKRMKYLKFESQS